LSFERDDFSDTQFELEDGIYLKVVVQKEHLRRWLAVVDYKLFIVGNHLKFGIFRVLILELLQNGITELRMQSVINIDWVALSKIDEFLSENVDESLLIFFFEGVDIRIDLHPDIIAHVSYIMLFIFIIGLNYICPDAIIFRSHNLIKGEYYA
jgi:hypothetical protein